MTCKGCERRRLALQQLARRVFKNKKTQVFENLTKGQTMTKTVRVENADTSNWRVKVDVYDMIGSTPDPKVDTLVKTIDLDYPTAMTGPNEYITAKRYMVVRESI